MAKRQVNMRVSDMTRDKLDFLSKYYGTQAEAVAVAVDRLYQETRYGYGDYQMSDLKMVVQEKYEIEDVNQLDPGEERIRVLIVEHEPHIRDNIAKLLAKLDMDVVGIAASGEEGVELAQQLQPHIVLMDRLMPEMGGLIASRAITQQVPYTRVIMTAVQGAESLRRSMLAGARDCLSRPFGEGDLSHSIRRVYALSPYLPLQSP